MLTKKVEQLIKEHGKDIEVCVQFLHCNLTFKSWQTPEELKNAKLNYRVYGVRQLKYVETSKPWGKSNPDVITISCMYCGEPLSIEKKENAKEMACIACQDIEIKEQRRR